MSRHNDFNFNLYRLTVIDEDSFLPFIGESLRTDQQIEAVFRAATSAELDYRQETMSALYIWGLRDFVELSSEEYPDSKAFSITFAKATIEKDGSVFTPDTVEQGTSIAQPPPAIPVTLIIQMTRHLVAVEHKTTVTSGYGWLRGLHEILRRAAVRLGFRSVIELQSKPKKLEILSTFSSFQTLTRIKVQLLLPNPELTRLTQNLFEELRDGGIREYIADMRNPNGLSQREQKLPHAAAAMAEDGYKKGEVILEGYRNGRKEVIKTGVQPAKGKLEGYKTFVRGLSSVATTQEGKRFADAMLREIDRTSDEAESA